MKPGILIFAFLSSCKAFAVPLSGRNVSLYLEPRMNNQQQLQDPDNEGTYQDPTTGNQIQKSMILTGVGPEAADNRQFDWDQSCSDPGQRGKIFAAWENFQELTTRASTQLGTLRASLPNPPANLGKPDAQNQAVIEQIDPAYTQYFKAHDTGLQRVQDSFTRVTDNVRNFAGRGPNGAVRFICNADNHVKNGHGTSYCVPDQQGAVAVPQPPHSLTIEQRYRFQRSSSIVFCPPFWDDAKLPNIDALVGAPMLTPADLTLDKVDCRERVMLHEYMHLPWVRNMNPSRDTVGWLAVAQRVSVNAWNVVSALPDCYAMYALYSYFNNDFQGCGTDIWPPNVEKPVKIT